MTDQTVARKLELRDAHAGALDFALIEIGRLNILNKISFPDVLHTGFVTLLADAKKILRAGVAIGKNIGAVENKFLVVDYVHDQGRVGHGEIFHGFAAAVDQPMPGVERRREQAPWTPFEHLLAPAVGPDFRGALAVENADYFLIEMFF